MDTIAYMKRMLLFVSIVSLFFVACTGTLKHDDRVFGVNGLSGDHIIIYHCFGYIGARPVFTLESRGIKYYDYSMGAYVDIAHASEFDIQNEVRRIVEMIYSRGINDQSSTIEDLEGSYRIEVCSGDQLLAIMTRDSAVHDIIQAEISRANKE